jgi:hypothetical protein
MDAHRPAADSHHMHLIRRTVSANTIASVSEGDYSKKSVTSRGVELTTKILGCLASLVICSTNAANSSEEKFFSGDALPLGSVDLSVISPRPVDFQKNSVREFLQRSSKTDLEEQQIDNRDRFMPALANCVEVIGY